MFQWTIRDENAEIYIVEYSDGVVDVRLADSLLLCDVAATPDKSGIAVFDISMLHQGYYILAISDSKKSETVYKFRIE